VLFELPVVKMYLAIQKIYIQNQREQNLSKLIHPNSKIVCGIRDEIFSNRKGNYTIEDIISVVVYAIRHVNYSLDIFNWNVFEYYATPEETIERGLGDCEDFAILTCSILRSMDLDAWVIIGKKHAWVRVFDGGESFDYFPIENLPEYFMFNEKYIVSLN
jgi:hypothetical protein